VEEKFVQYFSWISWTGDSTWKTQNCERIIFKQILNNMQGQEMDWTVSGHSTLAGSCKNCNKTSGLIKCGEFVDHKHTTICFLKTVFHKNYPLFQHTCKLITKQVHYFGTDADCCYLQLLYSANTTSTFFITWAISCALMYNVPQNVIHGKINASFLETTFNFYPTGMGIDILGHGLQKNILFEQKKR